MARLAPGHLPFLDDMAKLAHRPLPPLQALDRMFTINPSSPSWLKWKNGKKQGKNAGYLEKDGYWRVKLTFEGAYLRFPVHRIIYALFYKVDPRDHAIDHIKDKFDNNPHNLRLAGKYGNQQNAWKRKSNASSEYKGVSRSRKQKRWQASIRANGKHYYLGCFDTETTAAMAYDGAAKELHGEYAVLNFPESLRD